MLGRCPKQDRLEIRCPNSPRGLRGQREGLNARAMSRGDLHQNERLAPLQRFGCLALMCCFTMQVTRVPTKLPHPVFLLWNPNQQFFPLFPPRPVLSMWDNKGDPKEARRNDKPSSLINRPSHSSLYTNRLFSLTFTFPTVAQLLTGRNHFNPRAKRKCSMEAKFLTSPLLPKFTIPHLVISQPSQRHPLPPLKILNTCSLQPSRALAFPE